VQQHGLSLAGARSSQEVGGGGPDGQQAGRFREGQRGWLDENVGRGHGDGGRVPARDQRSDDLVTSCPAAGCELGSRPQRRHHAGHLVPDGQRQQRAILARRDVFGVGRVHPGGAHGDGDLARPGIGHVGLDVAQDLGTSEVDRDPFPCREGHRYSLVRRTIRCP
jgi:hypothetical protein